MAWQSYGLLSSDLISLRGDDRLQALRYLDFHRITVFLLMTTIDGSGSPQYFRMVSADI